MLIGLDALKPMARALSLIPSLQTLPYAVV